MLMNLLVKKVEICYNDITEKNNRIGEKYGRNKKESN